MNGCWTLPRIIAFSRLALLNRLEYLISNFLIPFGVVEEIKAGPPRDPAVGWLADLDTSHLVRVETVSQIVASWDLGRGESEILTLCHEHPGTGAVLDDLTARKCATSLGIPVRGTLALLVTAKRRGVIPEVAPLIDALPQVGFRISSHLAAEVLRLAGEE